MSPTISDVARRAGVSANTVSKIVNLGKESEFLPETIQRVRRAARALNYRRHQFARSLRTGRTGLVGITTVGADPGYFDRPYSAQVYRGIAEALKQRQLRLVFHNYDDQGNPEQYLDMIESRAVDGVIFLLLSSQVNYFRSGILKKLKALAVPFVAVHSLAQDIGCYSVGVDCEEAGYLASKHLVKHGYTSFGCLRRKAEEPHGLKLCQGYARALQEHQFPVNRNHDVLVDIVNYEAGYEAADRLVKTGKKLPRALFSIDERLAYGMLRRFAEANIGVPEDVALTAFGGVHYDAQRLAGLTFAGQPAAQKGERAAKFLLEMLDDPGKMKKPKTYIFKPELIVQTSCGCT